MRKLLGTIVFCLILLLLTFGSAFVISAQETVGEGIDLAGEQSGPPTKSRTSLPFGVTTIDSNSVSLNVRLEGDSAGEMPGKVHVSAEVHFNAAFSPEVRGRAFGPEARGRIRLRRASEDIVVSGPLRSFGHSIKCNTVPGSQGYPYYATEQTFLLEQVSLDGRLAENELVYADVVIVDQDGEEYGVSGLQARVTK